MTWFSLFSCPVLRHSQCIVFLMARFEASYHYGITGKLTDTSVLFLVLLSVRETEAVPSDLIQNSPSNTKRTVLSRPTISLPGFFYFIFYFFIFLLLTALRGELLDCQSRVKVS